MSFSFANLHIFIAVFLKEVRKKILEKKSKRYSKWILFQDQWRKLKLKKKEESERRAREEEARKVKEANETNAEGGESWKPYHQEVPSLFEDLMDLSGPPEEEALAFSPSASVPKPETPVSQSPSVGNLLDF